MNPMRKNILESCEEMNTGKQKWIIVGLSTALGLLGMALQNRVLQEGFDAAGLIIMDQPPLWAAWILTGAYLAAGLVLANCLGEGGGFEENFPPCFYSGTASVVAGLIMSFYGISAVAPGNGLRASSALVMGLAMALAGIFRFGKGKTPWWLDMVIFLGYGVVLIRGYREWNVDPRLQEYAYTLLAFCSLTLFSLHRARCIWGYADRRMLIFFGLAGLYLSFLAIPGSGETGFFFASAVWCAGGLCELNKQKNSPPEETVTEDNEV